MQFLYRLFNRARIAPTPALARLAIVPVCAMLAFSSSGFASTIFVDPSSQGVASGSTAVVQIGFSRVGDLSPQFLSAFDIQLSYDPSLLTLLGVTHGDPVYGNQLDLSGFGTMTFDDTFTPGIVHLMELSFDSPALLEQQQLSRFTLATLSFQAAGAGQSPLALEVNMLTDQYGMSIQPSAVVGGSIAVGQSPVPEPAMFVLFGSGLAVLGLWGRRRRLSR